jgi:hypothetical protein
MATKRGYYREELERAVDNLEMCLTHLARVVTAYDKDHPEISVTVKNVGDVIVEAASVLNKVHESI